MDEIESAEHRPEAHGPELEPGEAEPELPEVSAVARALTASADAAFAVSQAWPVSQLESGKQV